MQRKPQQRRGATLALVAIMLPVIIILAAFAVNVAYMELNRTELRVACDAATRAAGKTYAMTGNVGQSRSTGMAIALQNEVAGEGLKLDGNDFVFGQSTRSSNSGRYTFSPGGKPMNSVQVTASRTKGSAAGPVRLLFPNTLGRSTFEPVETATSTQVEVDIALVMDRSGSMAYGANEVTNTSKVPAGAPSNWEFCMAAPPKSRWLDAIAATDVFIKELNASPGVEHLSLATYSTSAKIEQQLLTDYAPIAASMDVYTQQFCGGSTNIGGGIDQGRLTLINSSARPWAAKVIVVMTDGIHNTGTDPLQAAQRAADANIQVFAVTFSKEADQARMQKVANIGHGKHYYAKDGNDLKKVFQDIAAALPTLLTN
jgi:Mg-chelatase subunit ChlD